MSDTERPIAELIGWKPGTYESVAAIDDWIAGMGYVTQIEPTADDLLAWLSDHTCPDCFTVTVEARNCVTRDDGCRVEVSCCSLPNGGEWPDIAGPSLLAALEQAVRAVAT